MISLLLAAALLSSNTLAAADIGQRSRPLRNDRQGLLEVNPLYLDMAARTGGDFYFWAPGEFSTAGLRIPIAGEAVVLAYGKLDGGPRHFDIPVESGVRALTVFTGAQRQDFVVLVRPDGSAVADGMPGVKLQTFRHMLIATIDAPVAGTWRLDLSGAGQYSLSAQVRPVASDGTPELLDFEFVEVAGRLGHQGWFPIKRELRQGEMIQCSAAVAGDPGALQFAFVTGDGQPIAVVPMRQEEADGDYFGHCRVPDRPFRVVLSGRDRRGQPFRRIQSPLRTPR